MLEDNSIGFENLSFFFFLVSGQTSVELEIEFSQIFRPIFQIFLHFRFLRVTLDLNFNRIQEKNRNVFEKQDQGLTKQDGYTYILGRNDPSFTFSTEINDERTRNFDACQNYGGTILKQDSTTWGGKWKSWRIEIAKRQIPGIYLHECGYALRIYISKAVVPSEVLDRKSRGCTECTVSRYTSWIERKVRCVNLFIG